MNKKQRDLKLRAIAEAQIARVAMAETAGRPEMALLHELRVHQIELEMQNDALRLAQIDLERLRQRYTDLYEFAPIAYLTLDASGHVTEINLTGATLLGEERGTLRNRRFESFVVTEHQGRWRQHFERAIAPGAQPPCELGMQRTDGTLFNGYLSSSLTLAADGASELRIALTDITDQRQAEEARRQFETRLHKLTMREREVLVLAVSGMINRDIASRLGVSQRTIENHRARIHRKTGAVSLLELVQQAAAAGVAMAEIARSSDAAAI